jgi:hypothetical protein
MMSKRILLCLSHAIEEYQQLDLLTSLGYEVASLGAYIDPADPHVDIRPPLDIPKVDVIYDESERIKPDEPQENLSDKMLEWLGDDGIIIYHHYLERLYEQWPRIRDWMRGSSERRVIWRSVGQSVKNNEHIAGPYRMGGLERVAYSPLEANIPEYSGHDAVIRFWGEAPSRRWYGAHKRVITVAQNLRQREPYTNWAFWDSATRGLPRLPIGPGSEIIGGTGSVTPERLRLELLENRAFVFTGTQPASYTLGLVEALHAGIPTISIGPAHMNVDYDGHTSQEMFEGHILAPLWSNDPNEVHHMVRKLFLDMDYAKDISERCRANAKRYFDRDTVGEQWKAFLG